MRSTLLLALIPSVAIAAPRVVIEPTSNPEVSNARVVDDGAVQSLRAASRTLYLNKDGITVVPGSSDSRTNKSSVASIPTTIPAWQTTPQMWSQTVTCLREMYAPFDVVVTDIDPGPDVSHIEAVFGGSPTMLGLPIKVAGVSPFSSSCKIIENSIVFTFTDVLPQNARVACEVMAQEIAHSYGLDHELLASDPMTYLPYNGERWFQDQMADCGEATPRACGISGAPACRDRQNSYALLMERIGAAGTGDIDPPTVAITSPADNATVDPGFTVTATVTDDVRVKFASLSIDGVSQGSLTAAPWSFIAPADLAPGKHTIEIKATDGANEKVATIEVTIRGDEDDSKMPIPGCRATTGGSWLFCLFLIGLAASRRRLISAIQRRAQR